MDYESATVEVEASNLAATDMGSVTTAQIVPDGCVEPVLRAAAAGAAGIHSQPSQCGWPHAHGNVYRRHRRPRLL